MSGALQMAGLRDVLIEFRPVGNAVKVSAMDPETLTEVTIQGPAHASEAVLRKAVIDKLEYRLRQAAGLQH
jgi:hypothetical protein